MNNPLGHDFEELKFSTHSQAFKENTVDQLRALGVHVEDRNSLSPLTVQLFNCEICGKQFGSKKNLRVHIHSHLGKPQVLLHRITHPKLQKSKQNSTYWLAPENKGSLKLTLKKHNFTESLKLKLKKSPESADFTVVNSPVNLGTKNHHREAVAETKENDHRDDKEAEDLGNRPFNNVMVEQQDGYESDKFNADENNPLEENDRPSIDVNEGDSGVGSDMANPLEKEDQNVDDLQATDQYDNSDKRLSETEDHEEEALEATCRETIENLKKLGEQSGTTSQLIDSSSVEEDDERRHESNMIHNLEENPAISIISKSSTFSNHSAECVSVSDSEDKPEESTEGSSGFNWNQLSADLTNKANENSKENEEQPDNVAEGDINHAGSLLQNFLIEHQRRSQGEALANSLPVETEYVSLEKLAETVNTCRVCNEKFKDISHLDEHRSKAGHYQCNIPECGNLILHTPMEVSMHKAQVHGTPLSPNLPAPVQQLAQQVQRMPLPQAQLPSSLPPGGSTMIPGPNYFVQSQGRPPLYRVPGPQGMHYPPHIAHLYPQYGPGPYPQMTAPPQMHPQLSQPIPRGRYPSAVQSTRAPRMPQTGLGPRQRMKRPIQQPMQVPQQNNSIVKQRRMDILLPDRNEDADCHVIAQQKRNDGLPVIQNVQGAITQQNNRNDSTIHLTDSITLSVRQPAQIQNASGPSGKKSDAKAVANVLAARGITVTPAANKNKTSDQNKQQLPVQQQQQQQQRPSPSQPPLNVTALNLNSAISIIPASSQRKQQEQTQFAVPQNKQNKTHVNEVERPPRPPTVDLTQDAPPQAPVVRRGRPPRALLTCQVCDKSFQNQEMFAQHMATHRTTNKLPYKCNLCPAQYQTGNALVTHKQTYHREVDTVAQNGGAELAIPVVDLKSPHVLNCLSSLGIQSYIPLSQLSAQTGGYFGLPIITIDGARNPNACNLGALGATSILSLGPLKHLSTR